LSRSTILFFSRSEITTDLEVHLKNTVWF